MPDSPPIRLIPVNPADEQLIATMTARTAPRWIRLAAVLAMEGRRVVLVSEPLPAVDVCPACGHEAIVEVRAFHKNAFGGDPRCVTVCTICAREHERRPLVSLEKAGQTGRRSAARLGPQVPYPSVTGR